ncbi:hypothetical protein KS4_29830 [Poriferisphaera corsica]|uniref:Uncharacterized protein n=1 Tax=Poriferisphaera corsica TaxID=2528020 RepID=A0A517YXF3_9BACT|nr:hypothetical protein KS4_29830 [Poriferisphaera corsica]
MNGLIETVQVMMQLALARLSKLLASLTNRSLRKNGFPYEPASDCFAEHMARKDATCSRASFEVIYYKS